ncbi:MAG TPA: fibronectin type III-like domain-contianing protein, partial [Desulfobacterales bacterium]|nr:fibronectin type III-like domain-contianing protein [Desulfobacterales bacterium]
TVVVLSNGAPVELPWTRMPAALVEAYLGGQAGGSALVDVLFGEQDPGGRLPETFPIDQRDILADRAFPGQPRQVQYRENLYVGYRQFVTTGQRVRFPFGHGLSYTEFELGRAEVPAGTIAAGQNVSVSVPVENIGRRAGSTVVQVYVRQISPPVHRPERELRGFAKVRLGPGERITAEIPLDATAFSIWDRATGAWQTVAGAYELLIGFSSADIRSVARIDVRSEFAPEPLRAPRRLAADDTEFADLLGRPVPRAEPLLPFTRTSQVADLAQTALGRQVQKALVSAARRRLESAVADPLFERLLDAVVMQMPLRNLVTMSGGRLSWRMLDGLVHALNGRWFAAVRSWVSRPG